MTNKALEEELFRLIEKAKWEHTQAILSRRMEASTLCQSRLIANRICQFILDDSPSSHNFYGGRLLNG